MRHSVAALTTAEPEPLQWLRLEPEVIALVAKHLDSNTLAALRLSCKTWMRGATLGIERLRVVRKVQRRQLQSLPASFPWVQFLDLSGYAWLTDPEILALKDLPQLRRLEVVFGEELSEEGLRGLQELTQLESLGLLKFSGLQDQHLSSLQPLVNLKELKIQGSPRLTDKALELLAALTSLEKLEVAYSWNVTDAGLENLRALPHLQQLALVGCKGVDGTGLRHLQRPAQMTSLDLSRNAKLVDQGLQSLQRMTRLCHLSLAFCPELTDAALKHINRLPLKALDLTKCTRMTETGVASSLKNLARLQRVNLTDCPSLEALRLERSVVIRDVKAEGEVELWFDG